VNIPSLMRSILPRDLDIELQDVELDEAVNRNELRWKALELGMREAEIAALLAQGVAVAKRLIEALTVD
jgi:hypothetical protein